MISSKAIVILTNFWNANAQINYGLSNVNFLSDDYEKVTDYSVWSIALRDPSLDKLKHLSEMKRLDFFCPTYELLRRYKDEGDWEAYIRDYRNILISRKEKLKSWLVTVKPNHIYFLCCWENTAGKSHCHRELLYEAFLSSKNAREKIVPIYMHGDKVRKE